MENVSGKLRIVICHASENKPIVQALYDRLVNAGYEPWLDSKELLPGMVWDMEIKKALRGSDAVIICLSSISVAKEGYIQKELKFSQDIFEEKPRGTIFLIPLRLDNCEIPFDLQHIQWGNYTAPDGFDKLIQALNVRAEQLGKAPAIPKPTGNPIQDVNGFAEIQIIIEQIKGEIPFGRFFEFGDDVGVLKRINTQLENLRDTTNALKGFYASKPLLKDSNPYFEVLMIIQNLQDFLVEVQKKGKGSKENTSHLRLLIAGLEKSIMQLSK